MQKTMRLVVMTGILGFVFLGWFFTNAPAQDGNAKTAYILYSSSSHGYFDPCG
ncbi:MAG: hypothetical protein Q9P14_17945 [candidate division KSB1 bacterium]|nr:hypothetical protein [candidate division KSB1 bacterium]MDQ7065338.1 hypothetical protein [candidate division KSB1 bacterium]